MIDRDTLVSAAGEYDDQAYPEEPYLESLEVLRCAKEPGESVRAAVRCLFLWKLGKISLHPTPTSAPLGYRDGRRREYHGVGMTRANRAAVERATARESLQAGLRFRDGAIGYEEFRGWAAGITGGTIVLPAFYVHIWRPAEWPILDRNVWRTFCRETGRAEPRYGPGSWADYEAYTAFFRRPVAATGLDGRTVDRGLWVLGGGVDDAGRCRGPGAAWPPRRDRAAQAVRELEDG